MREVQKIWIAIAVVVVRELAHLLIEYLHNNSKEARGDSDE